MKIVTWNVNGLRACMTKGFMDYFNSANADIFCVQETKMQKQQADFDFSHYSDYWNSAEKKGYSGTAVFGVQKPLNVSYGIGIEKHDKEGRVITCEYEKFFLVNVYTPNSQKELARLDYRMDWEDDFKDYLCLLDKTKPVICCGDLNVAHNEIDLKNPKTNTKNAGFTPQERQKLSAILDSGFTDAFRLLYPDKEHAYTWWSYMNKSRERNAGWRIDYFLVSNRIEKYIDDVVIRNDIFGSDHCPVELLLKDSIFN